MPTSEPSSSADQGQKQTDRTSETSSPGVLQEPANPESDTPQIGGITQKHRGTLRATMLGILAVLAVIYTLYFARALLLPVVMAILLNFLLQPFTRWLHQRLKFPYPLAAVVIALVFATSVVAGGYALSYPMLDWVEQAPQSMDRIQNKFASGDSEGQGNVLDKANRLLERVESLTNMESGSDGAGAGPSLSPSSDGEDNANEEGAGKSSQGGDIDSSKPAAAPGPDPVRVRRSGEDLSTIIMGYITAIGKAALTAGILVFFLLASGDTFLRKLMHVLPRVHDKKKAAVISHQVEHHISTFLVTYTAINICLGLATTGVMWLIGMPNPWLWGAIAAIFNFVPYIGPVGVMGILLVVGLLEYDTFGHALVAPACFFGLNLCEAYGLTPMLLGKRLSLHPVAVLVSITFWSFIWGVAGAIIAVPLLVAFKIVCDYIEPLEPISEFLSGETTQRPSDEDLSATEPDKHPSPQPSVKPGS